MGPFSTGQDFSGNHTPQVNWGICAVSGDRLPEQRAQLSTHRGCGIPGACTGDGACGPARDHLEPLQLCPVPADYFQPQVAQRVFTTFLGEEVTTVAVLDAAVELADDAEAVPEEVEAVPPSVAHDHLALQIRCG